MYESPPRRSRRPPSDGPPPVPFIPIFIGVIVLGLVIGAGLSLLGKRNEPQVVTQRVASARPTLAPVTPAPTEKPAAEPTLAPETPAAATTPAARSVATSAPAGEATSKPPAAVKTAPHPVRSAPAATEAVATPVVRPPARVKAATGGAPAALANAAVTVAPVRASPTGAPAGSDDVDSEFAKLAASVVRQYISAVARGDVPSAYGALGESMPDNNANLPEMGTIDGNTRIRHVEARGSGDAAAVNVDMQGRGGLFFGQFTVHKTPSGAAVIVQHTLVKP